MLQSSGDIHLSEVENEMNETEEQKRPDPEKRPIWRIEEWFAHFLMNTDLFDMCDRPDCAGDCCPEDPNDPDGFLVSECCLGCADLAFIPNRRAIIICIRSGEEITRPKTKAECEHWRIESGGTTTKKAD